VGIANLQASLNVQIIPGSTEILKPADFMQQLEKLHKKENEAAFLKGPQPAGNGKDLKGVTSVFDDNDETNLEEEEDQDYAINV
jgi:hypothetical protein